MRKEGGEMKRLRRWAIPVLLAFLMFSCAGCGDSAPVTEDEGDTPPSGSVSAESTPVYSFPSGPEEQSAGYKLGRIYKTMEEAEEHLREITGKLELVRNNYETVTRCLTEKQNKEKELEGQQKTVSASVVQSQEEVQKKIRSYKQIIKVCEPGIEATPDALDFYYYLAIAYHQAEQPDSVLSVCTKALEHVTTDTRKEIVSNFYSIMGDIYHTKKQMKEAYAAYDSALVYNPSNIGTLNNYAYYLSVERRDLDKAEEMSYKTVKAEPNNATYLDTYAWILFEKGNYAEARIYIDNAMKSDEEKSDVVVEHCGDIYFMTGDVEGALKYWKKALEMGSESKTLKEKIEKKKYIAE